MKRFKHCSLVLAMLAFFASSALAQMDQGHLTGTVTDAQNAVLPGVTVTATSPALMGGRTSITEADGKFKIGPVPAGVYTITYELSGFQTTKRTNIVLGLGQTLNVDGQLQVASLQETVTVSAQSPVVDMQSTKVGTDFTTEKLTGVPTATDIWAVLGQASGVRMNGFDVGGSHKSQQTGYESFGLRNQTRVLNDGVDTTEGTGGSGFYADFYANEEVSVAAGGGDVEMNTPGAAVVSTIKSGGNQFKGLEHLSYEPPSWVGNNIDQATSDRGFTGQPNLKFWEAHFDLGGPIVTDKLWFYGALNRFVINKAISGLDQSIATDLGQFWNYTTKETWKASSKDTVIGYLQRGLKDKPLRGLSATVPPESAQPQHSWSWVYKGEWQRVASQRMFIDVKGQLFGYDFPLATVVDPAVKPPRINNSTNVSGAAWDAFDLARQKPQIIAQSTYFVPDKAGSHDLKVGFEYILDISKYTITGASGPIRYLDTNGKTDQIQFVDVGKQSDLGSSWVGGNNRNQRYSAYFQDRWSPNDRTTITGGLRWDHQRPYYLSGVRNPIIQDVYQGAPIFSPQTTVGKDIFTRDSFAPRIGVSYDISGKGNTVVKAFYGRFYYNYADQFSSLNPGSANYKTYKFNDLNGNGLYDGPQELTGNVIASVGGTTTTVDPNMKKPYADEYDVSLEHQFWQQSSIRVAYVRKQTANEYATLNIARVGRYTVPVTVPVTVKSFNGTATTVNYNLMDLPDKPTAVNEVTNIPDGSYKYDTLQFAFNKRFRTGLFIQASYDYQWRNELRGNASFTNTNTISPTTSPLNSDPIGIGYYMDVNPAVGNRQKTTNWQGRAIARYEFKYEIGFAANLRAQSGFGYAEVLSAPLPNAGTTRFFAQDLSSNKSDTTPILDFRIDKAFKINNRFRITGMFDLFNTLNSNAVTNFVLTSGNYNQIIATLDPRTAQLGIRLDF
jgi:Carboxypeptidase regulatory-like domain/TonB dependent receptor